jgi:hypothetical protein
MGNDGISTQAPGYGAGSPDGVPASQHKPVQNRFGNIHGELLSLPVTLRRRAELSQASKNGELKSIEYPNRGNYNGQ